VDGDQDQDQGAGSGKGVLLAVAIVLLWLAGACLWLAFEGTSLLPDSLPVNAAGKPSRFLGMVEAIAGRVQSLQQQGLAEAQQQQQQGG
jgi:hypothetical protein